MADYAISNVPRRVVYAASGVGPYAFTFEILDQTDIAVYKGSTLLTLTTDYTVSINGTTGTGEVTLVATAGTSNITIVGAKNIQRTSDFTTGGDLFADTLNDELDNQTIFIQQVAETAERGLKAPVTDPTDIAMTLPDKAGRRGKVLAFDSTTGNPVAGPSLDSMVTVIEQSAYINAVGENIDDVIAVADNEANIDTVAGVSSAVTTVATNISNVNTVADDLNEDVSEIHVVGTNIANVNTVGTNIASVNTVAGNNSNVTTVAGISANVTTVAGISSAVSNVSSISSAVTGVNSNSSNINTVAGQITPTNNVSTVAGISANVSTVAGISANVTTVATNNTNVSTVATNIANVNSVGGNIANVNSVAGNATNINAVNANATNINTVAGINANVTTVATNNANVTTVATNIASVNTVAGNTSNINQVASDTVAINSASANATSAAASALSASNSATSASASAAAASAVSLGNEPVRHSVRPSLLLDFANTKQLDPRITFTRASTGTYYDGKTVAKAEENLLIYSEQFDNAYWVKTNTTVTANSTTAPDGTSTADTLISDGTSTIHRINSGVVSATSSVGKTFSIFAKANTNNFIQVYFLGSSDPWANFDLSAGTVGSSGTNQTATITSAGNGWYRCIIYTPSTLATSPVISIVSSSSVSRGETNSLSTSVFIWGAQEEFRNTVTAYTATTTQPITNYIPALQTAASGVARFEHNPVTGESLGLEIEEQRTNLLTYSEDYSNAAWNKSNSTVTANTIVAPDGTLTGEKLIANTSLGIHFASQGASVSSGTTYTLSCFIKAGEETTAMLSLSTSPFPRVKFNLSSGAIISSASGGTGTITSVGNGWYRCTVSFTAPATSIDPTISIRDTDTNWTGNGFGGIYIWGAQLEAGSFATSYIPTVASQVTRSADVASMTGTNFSSWYRGDEFTLYVDYSVTSNLQYRRLLYLGNSVIGGNYTYAVAINSLNITNGNMYAEIFTNNTQAAVDLGATTANGFNKIALAVKTNNVSGANNGVLSATDTSCVVPPLDRMLIGRHADGLYFNGTIKKIANYQARLTNAELQGLTTV
jgi:hypothetical protein